jgi:methionine sulfoxide reductase heme-binding subunit
MSTTGLNPATRLARWGMAAITIGIVLGATLPTLAAGIAYAIGTNAANLPWYAERLFAFLAYLAVWGAVVYGLLLSTKILDAIAHRPVTFALHQDLAIAGLILAGIHGGLLSLDHTMPFSPAQIAVPFLAPYLPLWVGIGQVAFYLTAVVVLSFYVRRHIGQRTWRLLHYLTFLAFFGAAGHGLVAGSDSGAQWAWWLYVGSSATVVFLTAYRIVLSLGFRVTGGVKPPARPRIPAPAASRDVASMSG